MFHFQKWLVQCWNAWLINSPKCLYTNFLWDKCSQELNKCHCHCLSSCSELSSLKYLVHGYLEDYCLNHLGGKGERSRPSQVTAFDFFFYVNMWSPQMFVCFTVFFCIFCLFACLSKFIIIIIIIWVSFLKTSTLGSVCSGTGFLLQSRLLSVTVDGS